ncbi:unnamed protein product [Leuciscus chuanchicus]
MTYLHSSLANSSTPAEPLLAFSEVTVNIKMVHALEEKETVVRGQRVRRKSVVAADANDLLLFTLWGQHDLMQGSWYKLENVSVRQFKAMATLSTTVQTTISQMEDCGAAKEFTDADLQIVVGEIVDAEVKVEHFCPKHHLVQTVNASTLMTRCNECKAFCKTAKTTVEFRGHVSVMVKSTQQKIYLDDVQIRDLLKLKADESVDSHSLVADILVHDEMCIQTWREFVAKVTFNDQSASSSSEPSDAVADRRTGDSSVELEGEEAEDLDALFEGL